MSTPTQNDGFTLGPLPWSPTVLEKAYFRAPTATQAAVREHPGYPLHQRLSALRACFAIFDESVSEWRFAVADFHEGAHFGHIFRRPNQAQLDRVLFRVRKAAFVVAQSAMALVDHCRHVKNSVDRREYQEKVKALFADDPEHLLIQQLRRLLFHVRLVDPQWRISLLRAEPATTEFLITPEEIPNLEEWPQIPRAYVTAHRNGIDLCVLIESYSQKVTAFHRWLLGAIESSVGSVIREYLDYERQLKAIGERSWWRIVFTQILGPRNPYDYLSEHLDEIELKEVYALPMRSRAQIDRIIELVDENGACDDELRSMVYKAFKVRD